MATWNDAPDGTQALLVKGAGKSFVYVQQEDQSFHLREVVPGHAFGNRVQLVKGITPGERVVVGGSLLIDGAIARSH